MLKGHQIHRDLWVVGKNSKKKVFPAISTKKVFVVKKMTMKMGENVFTCL